jgi:phosphatidylglycerophosphate synthase
MEKNVRRYFFSVFVQDIFAIPLAKLFIKLNIKANYVTLIGLISSIASGLLYINHSYIIGSFLFFVALVMDSTDGRVARGTNTFSDFGAKLDAVTDKVRSFFVALCFIWSMEYDASILILLFGFYITLPIIRLIMSRNDKEFYDPTILFWDATPFRNWFIKNKVWGFYNGWERSVLALAIAPIVPYQIEVLVGAIVLEMLLFLLGHCFFQSTKVGW